jgi:cytochrome P450
MEKTLAYQIAPAMLRSTGLYGNMFMLWAAPTDFMQSIYDHFGDVVPMGGRHSKYVFAFGPARNQEIFSNTTVFQNYSFDDFPFLEHSKIMARELTLGLGFLNGTEHRERRRLLRPSFSRESVDQFTQVFVSLTENRLTSWKGREAIEIFPELEDLIVDIGLHTLMGLEPSPTADEVKKLFDEVFSLVFSIAYGFFPFDLPGTAYHRAGVATQKLTVALTELIEQKRQAGAHGDDILSQLVRLQAENPDFSMANLIGSAAGIFRGMYPNVASALVCAFILLALHPQIMEEVLQEIQDQLHGRNPTAEDLDCLKLLDAVIMETLRILPPAYWIARISRAPFVLGGHEFPLGSTVLLSPFVTQRMPEVYPEPDRFLPRRWIGVRHLPYAFIPFAVGVRQCLGQFYTIHLCKAVMATILQRYSLALLPHTKLDFIGTRRPAPGSGTFMKVGPVGIPPAPKDLRGNYRQFVNLGD